MTVVITVDGERVVAAPGSSLAAVLLNQRLARFRTSVTGQPRAPLCGMGTCFECRVTIDGVAHQRACLIPVRDGMTVATGG